MNTLKSCPFCGSDNIYDTVDYDSLGEEIPIIFCNDCKIIFKIEDDSMYLNHKERFADLHARTLQRWNTRK